MTKDTSENIMEVDICIVVDSNGDFSVGADKESTVEQHSDEFGTVDVVETYTFIAKVHMPKVKELGEINIPKNVDQYDLQLVPIVNQ